MGEAHRAENRLRLLMLPEVAAVIPTRGNVDMSEIVESLPFFRGVIWNNAVDEDLGVYGRYAAINYTQTPVIYTQDDDCVLEPESFELLLEAYEPGVITANMSEHHQSYHHDSALVGFGAIFDRELPEAAFKQWEHRGSDEFRRCCDVIFTGLTPVKMVNLPFRYLPWSGGTDRMFHQPGFAQERESVLERVRELR